MHKGLPKISENLLVITWILTLSPNFHLQLWSSHLGPVYDDPSDFAIFGSSGWSLPELACLVPLAIVLGSLQWIQNAALSPGISFKGTCRNRRGPGQVSKQGGEQWSCYYLSGIPSQQVRCVQEHCHGATTSLCSLKSQAICTSYFPPVVSKSHSKTSHWQSHQMERTPCAQFLEFKKKRSALTWCCCELGTIFFSHGEDGVFHCEDCCLVSGS